MTRSLLLSLSLSLLPLGSACVIGVDGDPDCRGDACPVDQTCSDARYGDGTCHADLSCDVPDIDCFTTFTSDAEGGAWYAGFEQRLATEEGRAPRMQVPTSDPRFAQARDLLDRGWAAFREHRPVGRLAGERPALVVLEDPGINAFVLPDLAKDRSAFLVVVQTGALAAGVSDDGMLGLMMHELQHAVGLHLLSGGKDRLRTFYVADGGEPIGNEQADDARARSAGTAWRAAAAEVGPFATAELGGLLIAGELDRIFVAVLASGAQNNPAGCAQPIARADQLRGEITAAVDPLDTSLHLDLSGVPARVQQTLSALRTQCVPGLQATFYQVVAALSGGAVTPEMVAAAMPAADRALVDGKHVLDGLAALVASRRAAMRAAEAQLATETGRPWSALRFFSYEEDADDVTVPVLRAAGFTPTGNGEFLTFALAPAVRARCTAELDAGRVPPYGIDLTDEHHATCWRAYHIDAIADRGERALRAHRLRPARAPQAEPAPLRLLPPRLRDAIMH